MYGRARSRWKARLPRPRRSPDYAKMRDEAAVAQRSDCDRTAVAFRFGGLTMWPCLPQSELARLRLKTWSVTGTRSHGRHRGALGSVTRLQKVTHRSFQLNSRPAGQSRQGHSEDVHEGNAGLVLPVCHYMLIGQQGHHQARHAR